jgi:hypothetical protein
VPLSQLETMTKPFAKTWKRANVSALTAGLGCAGLGGIQPSWPRIAAGWLVIAFESCRASALSDSRAPCLLAPACGDRGGLGRKCRALETHARTAVQLPACM